MHVRIRVLVHVGAYCRAQDGQGAQLVWPSLSSAFLVLPAVAAFTVLTALTKHPYYLHSSRCCSVAAALSKQRNIHASTHPMRNITCAATLRGMSLRH